MPSEVNVTDTTVIPEDFSAGDRVWIETEPGKVFFGTILESSNEQMRIRMDFNQIATITEDSLPFPLSEFRKRMGKVIDVPKLEVGGILSRLGKTPDGKRVREYAEVTEHNKFQKISLRFLEDPDDFPISYYGGRTSLEEQLRHWELEA